MCDYNICRIRSLFLLRISDSFFSGFRVGSFIFLQFNEYSTLSITKVSLPLPAGRIMILLLSRSQVVASLSDFEMFALGGFALSCASLNF